MYTTEYLKTDSYESLVSECEKVGLALDGEIITASHNHHLHIIGIMQRETGIILTDSEGNEYPETEPVEGYHANLRYKKDVGLNHLSIEVITPSVDFS